jgi:acetyl-CoA carboxylase biotin carboxylase subunit
MEQALAAFEIEGVTTSLPLLSRILAHPVFQHNTVTTHWLNELLTEKVNS